MKKNFLLLFLVYFFVVQPLIASFLWADMGFLYLGLINIVGIIAITTLYAYFVERTLSEDHDHHAKHDKKHAIFGGLVLLVIVSLLLALVGYFLLSDFLLALRFFLGGLVGFMIYFIGYFLSTLHRHFRFFKLIFTHIYLAILLISGVFLGLFFSSTPHSLDSLHTIYTSLLVAEETPQDASDVILVSGFVDSTIVEQTGTVLDVSTPEDIVEPEDTQFPLTELVKEEILSRDAWEKITMMDAIIYLIDTRSVPLSTSQKIRFTYVSTKNPYYAYYVTAYEKKMIGKDTHPSKNVLCETYMVMKGLSEGWTVPASSNIKKAYWDEATTKGVLNNCSYGSYVKVENL